jgi:hypothetical protein
MDLKHNFLAGPPTDHFRNKRRDLISHEVGELGVSFFAHQLVQ